jgi:RNA polymerase sigma-70 factor (ECF subfamily)
MSGSTHRSESSEIPDETLMERYANGDAAAFEELFRRYEPRAFSYFSRRLASADRAEDLYQEVFLRIHRARHRYDPARPFAPWFFQIAHRLLIDDRRRAYRAHEQRSERRYLEAAADHASDTVSDREQLARLFDGLSADERFVLVSAKGEGVSYSELARRLGRSVDAVKQLASRAARRLRASAAASIAMHGS